MSVDNRVSMNLTPEQQSLILTHLDTLFQDLDWTLSLSSTDRQRLSKAAAGTEPFMNQAFQLGQQYPEILPKSLSLEEMSRDINTRNFLVALKGRLDTLSQRVGDTLSVCGSEAFQASLTIYQIARTYGDDMGFDAQVQELAKRFKKVGKTTTSTAPVEG